MKNIIFLLTICVAISCKSDKATEPTESIKEQPTSVPVVSQDPVIQNMMNMLQGTWNSRNDKNTSITFQNNTRIETKNGITQGKMRYFEISDQCNNDTALGKNIVQAEAKYISMLDIDMCYFIKKITKNQLVLSYVGRDNTLVYVKNNTPTKGVRNQGKIEIPSKKSKK